MANKRNTSGISNSKTGSKRLAGSRTRNKPAIKTGSNGMAGKVKINNGVLPGALKRANSKTAKARRLSK